MDRVELSPYALASEDRAVAFIARDRGAEAGLEDWVPMMINAVSQQFERWCGRRLAARTYRNPVTIACTTTTDDETLQGTGFLTSVKVLDLITGSTVRAGTRVASITSATALEMSKKAASGAAASLIFGSAPLKVRGLGSSVLYVPESPVIELYSVNTVGWDGLSTPADTTNFDIDLETGRMELAIGGFDDQARIQIECAAGYRTSALGEFGDVSQLEWACMRMVQALWQDFKQQVGREGHLTMGEASIHVSTLRMPDDVREALSPYRRVG